MTDERMEAEFLEWAKDWNVSRDGADFARRMKDALRPGESAWSSELIEDIALTWYAAWNRRGEEER